jgi:hypothetical protein
MSDATLLAGELADVAAAVGRVAEALAGLRPQVDVAVPAPVVNVEAAPAPQVTVEPAQVNVQAPVVNVAAPSVSIAAPEAVGYTVRITERDAAGLIRAFRITPA